MEMYNVSWNAIDIMCFTDSSSLIIFCFVIVSMQDENRLKTNVIEVREMNYKEYNEKLIKDIKELSLSF